MKKKDGQLLLLLLAGGAAAYFLFKGSSQVTAQRQALINKITPEDSQGVIVPVFRSMSDGEITTMYNWLILQQPPNAATAAIQAKYNLYGT